MTASRNAAASLWLAAAFVLLSAVPADAALHASTGASRSLTVSTGTWKLDARLAPTDPWTGTSLLVAGISTKHILYFSLVNFGTVDLVGATLAVTVSKGGNQQVVSTLHTCSGTWDEVADTCSSGPAGIGTLLTVPWPSATAPVSIAISAGGSARIQVDSNLPGTQITVSVSVSSSSPRQIRTATDVSR